MEFGAILGIFGGIACIIASMLASGGNPATYYDPASLFMTVGGSFAALLIQCGWKDTLALFSIMGKAFRPYKIDFESLIMRLQEFSEKARREGLLALEEVVEEIDDAFMKNGLKLVVDGTDGEIIKTLMENELTAMNERHAKWCRMIDSWSKLAPGFGMLGTVLGLIAMLRYIEDKSRIGPNMAVALVTTFYGALMANFLLQPIMGKLLTYDGEETIMRAMVIEGVLSIQAGDNPRILTLKLLSYIDPKQRRYLEEKLLREG